MQKESLEKINDAFIEMLDNLDINIVDKTEMMININYFLKDYDNNVKTLIKKHNDYKKYGISKNK